MLKCDNCANPAQYTAADPGVNPAHYCTSCLPHWLRDRAEAGHFPLMSPIEQDKSVKKKTSAPKKADADEDN
jgi:hypothetical protein